MAETINKVNNTPYSPPSLEYTSDPTSDYDGVDTAGIGHEFLVGEYLFNITNGKRWVCRDNSTGAAVWEIVGPTDAEVKSAYEANADTNVFTDSEKSDLASNSAHRTNTNNPHTTDLGNLGSGTLAELNGLVTDLIATYGGVRDFGVGTLAQRPAAATTNRFWWATDDGVLYRDTGTVWESISAILRDNNGAASNIQWVKGQIADPSTISPSAGDVYLVGFSGTIYITDVTVGTKTIQVYGNQASKITTGMTINVIGSTGNDGWYTVVSSTWNTLPYPNWRTDIVVSEVIPSATVDGDVRWNSSATWKTQKIDAFATWSGSAWSYSDPNDLSLVVVDGFGPMFYADGMWRAWLQSTDPNLFNVVEIGNLPERNLKGIRNPGGSGYFGICPNATYPQWQFGEINSCVATYFDTMNGGQADNQFNAVFFLNALPGAGDYAYSYIGRGGWHPDDDKAAPLGNTNKRWNQVFSSKYCSSDPICGEMYISSPDETSITGSGWFKINATTTSAGELEEFTHTSPNRLTYSGNSFAVTAVDTTNEYFEISGDHRHLFATGQTFKVKGSTGNDGTYTVNSATYYRRQNDIYGTGNRTVIYVNENITDATADGTLWFAPTRKFKVDIALSASHEGSGKIDYLFAVAKNGTTFTKTEIQRQLSGSADFGSIMMTGLIELSQDEYIEAYVKNLDDTTNITVQSMNCNIVGVY